MEEFAQASSRSHQQRPVPFGPRHYRLLLRRLGAPFAMIAALAIGLLSVLVRWNNDSTMRGLLGFLLAILAFPVLLVVGAPLTATGSSMFLAVVVSLVLWAAFGLIAARRATRNPAATWRDFWREFAWFAGAVWSGVIVSLLAVNIIMGRAFL